MKNKFEIMDCYKCRVEPYVEADYEDGKMMVFVQCPLCKMKSDIFPGQISYLLAKKLAINNWNSRMKR